MSATKQWTQEEAIALATRIELIAPDCGAHIGLTGGCLYKTGPRKDLDIVVYRIRQVDKIDRKKFLDALRVFAIEVTGDHGFVVKTTMQGRTIDFLFPETNEGNYYRG